MARRPRNQPADHGAPGALVRPELWSVVRQLTPAEGLALVCLTCWVKPGTGLARASDRQVCDQTGVSRDVMKRLRRKLAAVGIEVTTGNHLSHDSCCYDFRQVLGVESVRQLRASAERAESMPRMLRGPIASAVLEAPSLGANRTEAEAAKSTEIAPDDDASLDHEPYAFISVSSERAPAGALAEELQPVGAGLTGGPAAGPQLGATPEGNPTPLPPTAPVWLPANVWDDQPEMAGRGPGSGGLPAGESDLPAAPPLPPYEQWRARR